MFIGLDLLEGSPHAELFYDQVNEEYELHLQFDSGVIAISMKEASTVLRLSEEIRDSMYRLPDTHDLCDNCQGAVEVEIPMDDR